jgi:hypothetical protein
MKRIWLCLAAFAFSASAADVTGTWKGTYETIERTFVFQTDGNKVTGETSSPQLGNSPITDGKLEGDTLTFTITSKLQGNEFKANFSGKVSGNEINFHVELSIGGTFDYVVKRVR